MNCSICKKCGNLKWRVLKRPALQGPAIEKPKRCIGNTTEAAKFPEYIKAYEDQIKQKCVLSKEEVKEMKATKTQKELAYQLSKYNDGRIKRFALACVLPFLGIFSVVNPIVGLSSNPRNPLPIAGALYHEKVARTGSTAAEYTPRLDENRGGQKYFGAELREISKGDIEKMKTVCMSHLKLTHFNNIWGAPPEFVEVTAAELVDKHSTGNWVGDQVVNVDFDAVDAIYRNATRDGKTAFLVINLCALQNEGLGAVKRSLRGQPELVSKLHGLEEDSTDHLGSVMKEASSVYNFPDQITERFKEVVGGLPRDAYTKTLARKASSCLKRKNQLEKEEYMDSGLRKLCEAYENEAFSLLRVVYDQKPPEEADWAARLGYLTYELTSRVKRDLDDESWQYAKENHLVPEWKPLSEMGTRAEELIGSIRLYSEDPDKPKFHPFPWVWDPHLEGMEGISIPSYLFGESVEEIAKFISKFLVTSAIIDRLRRRVYSAAYLGPEVDKLRAMLRKENEVPKVDYNQLEKELRKERAYREFTSKTNEFSKFLPGMNGNTKKDDAIPAILAETQKLEALDLKEIPRRAPSNCRTFNVSLCGVNCLVVLGFLGLLGSAFGVLYCFIQRAPSKPLISKHKAQTPLIEGYGYENGVLCPTETYIDGDLTVPKFVWYTVYKDKDSGEYKSEASPVYDISESRTFPIKNKRAKCRLEDPSVWQWTISTTYPFYYSYPDPECRSCQDLFGTVFKPDSVRDKVFVKDRTSSALQTASKTGAETDWFAHRSGAGGQHAPKKSLTPFKHKPLFPELPKTDLIQKKGALTRVPEGYHLHKLAERLFTKMLAPGPSREKFLQRPGFLRARERKLFACLRKYVFPEAIDRVLPALLLVLRLCCDGCTDGKFNVYFPGTRTRLTIAFPEAQAFSKNETLRILEYGPSMLWAVFSPSTSSFLLLVFTVLEKSISKRSKKGI